MATNRGLFQPPQGLVRDELPWFQLGRGPRRAYPERTVDPQTGQPVPAFDYAGYPRIGIPAPLRQPIDRWALGIEQRPAPVIQQAPVGPWTPGFVQPPIVAQPPIPGTQPYTYLPLAAGGAGAAMTAQAVSEMQAGATVGGPAGGGRMVDNLRTVQIGGAGGGAGGAGGGGAAGGLRDPIDPRIDKNWYHAFQREHDGQTPEEFYTGLPYDQLKYHRAEAGWALDEALDDLEWSRGFRDYAGRDPTDDDWKAWWMQNYGRDMRTDRERERDKIARKGGPGRKLPRFRGQEEPEQRPPLWVPPVTYWRT